MIITLKVLIYLIALSGMIFVFNKMEQKRLDSMSKDLLKIHARVLGDLLTVILFIGLVSPEKIFGITLSISDNRYVTFLLVFAIADYFIRKQIYVRPLKAQKKLNS